MKEMLKNLLSGLKPDELKNLLGLEPNDWKSWLSLAIGIGWFIICATSGVLLLVFLFEKVPEIIGSFLILYYILWVIALFLGRRVLGKLISPILYKNRGV